MEPLYKGQGSCGASLQGTMFLHVERLQGTVKAPLSLVIVETLPLTLLPRKRGLYKGQTNHSSYYSYSDNLSTFIRDKGPLIVEWLHNNHVISGRVLCPLFRGRKIRVA